MPKHKPPTKPQPLRPVSDAEIDAVIAQSTVEPTRNAGALSLHELFSQQVRTVLDSSDLDEEQKQSILVAMSCPCCGGGNGMLTYKLRPKK